MSIGTNLELLIFGNFNSLLLGTGVRVIDYAIFNWQRVKDCEPVMQACQLKGWMKFY